MQDDIERDPVRRSRRAVSVPGLFLVTALVIVTFPFAFAAAVLTDLAGRGRRRHRRILVFATEGLLIECGGVLATVGLWLAAGFGTRIHGPTAQRWHHKLQLWWVRRLAEAARRHLGLQFEITGDMVPTGRIIVLCRHACIADALLPAMLYGLLEDRPLHYVLKRDLQWGPCLDIVGNRLPNLFVDRSVRRRSQRRAITDLAEAMADDGALILFPEGTFPTPDRVDKARRRLLQADPERAERLRSLGHVLPPHPGGALAAMAGAPEADVHVVRHVGLEDAATLRALYRRVPFDEPMRVDVHPIRRIDIPGDPSQQVEWLDEQWLQLDRWVDEVGSQRHG
ncbi:MAG: 1-acyl-sn-glycerol-3-phosphate acyltransferase [Acidimicrobiia bacterium]|nr:1-acyl-sn-glycerol-3-phosphate acyltransferase [Acidimicrobiia bacterium]